MGNMTEDQRKEQKCRGGNSVGAQAQIKSRCKGQGQSHGWEIDVKCSSRVRMS